MQSGKHLILRFGSFWAMLLTRRTVSILPVASLATSASAGKIREASQSARVSNMKAESTPVRLALVGAGIFMKDAHIPSIAKLNSTRERPPFKVAAVYSRSDKSAQSALEAVKAAGLPTEDIQVYTDLAELLASSEIEAVNVVLPTQVMSDVVKQSLLAGKHVISEKPIAIQSTAAKDAISIASSKPDLVWMVGENFRYETVVQQAAEVVKSGKIGRPLVAQWALHVPVGPSMKYYNTEWRGKGQGLKGGWFLDMGVHHVATLRAILGDIAEVSGCSASFKDDLQPPDTVAATLRFQSGVLCNYSVCCAAGAGWPDRLSIVGDSGSMQVSRREKMYQIFSAQDPSEGPEVVNTAAFDGVEKELEAFAASIRTQQANLNSPSEALVDLAVIEAILESAETGNRVSINV